MNRNKRTCTILLAIVIALGVSLLWGIGSVLAEKAGVMTAAESDAYIYFDLAAGDVNIGKTTYTGYVFVNGTATPVTGAHSPDNKYYVYQSTETNKLETGYETQTDLDNQTKCRIPIYDRVKITVHGEEKLWTDYITNNTDVIEVSQNWETAAAASGRTATGNQAASGQTATGNHIIFANESDYTADVTIDNIWSYFQKPGATRSEGGITAHLKNSRNTTIQLRLKGDNRLGNIHYGALKGYKNQIIFSNGEDANQTPGSITVADFPKDFNKNHWCSAIGGDDNVCDRSDGIVINSGVIYAGTTPQDNCTAIGGGGNQYGGVTINGGTVTAVVSSTGTAIGGGIGYGDAGGDTDVIINDGTIYAYNLGITEETGGFSKFVPAAAIGGGGSNRQAGSLTANITINGGTIYAQSMGGAAIGGGCSANANGGPATINITGGTIIAKSTTGEYMGTSVQAGVSIGGGTGLTAGGSVTLNISGGTLRTGSIGGGLATKEGAKVGNATVTVSGGNIIGQVIMAGGAANPCSFTMTGGVIHTTDVIKGITIGETNITGVTVTDPQPDVPLSFIRQDGGAVFMNDPNGVAIITGGLIGNCTANNGGAVYMSGGKFILSGTGQLGTNHAKENGGSVYVGGGTVQIGGGVTDKNGNVLVAEGSEDAAKCAIRNSEALSKGGGVYVVGTADQTGATVTMKGGEIHSNTAGTDGGGMYIDKGKVDIFNGSIHDNSATQDGGGVYVAGDVHLLGGSVTVNRANNGGGFCVEDGTVLMYGGSISGNSATENGGGLHISAITQKPIVDIFSGSIINNKAKMGGGLSVVSTSDQPIYVTVGANCVHPDLNTSDTNRVFTPFLYPQTPADCGDAHKTHEHYHVDEVGKHSSCPEVKNNIAEDNGGGFYLSSTQSNLVFYCITEAENIANGNKQCYNMDVKGGHVEIGDKSYDHTKHDEPVKGNIMMQSSIFVEGGTVDIYGKMDNPKFTDDVTVDIKQESDHYIDHRLPDDPELTYYKVHYYENFKGDGDTPTGLYIARQYPDIDHDKTQGDEKYDCTIMSSIFSHPGYKIVGWNTQPDGLGEEYNVNETYNLKELDHAGKIGTTNSGNEDDDSLLVIYAIWERSGYVLKFDPNVGEGETYTGTMENQRVTVGLLDGTQKISPNQFKRHGYRFTGWTLTPSPTATDKVYADEEPIKTDFTGEDGATVTLYAQWEHCTHVDYLVYTAEENVLTQSCSACGGHTATATVSAVNAVYDGDVHLATVNFSSNWLGDKPEISYEMAASVWDEKDTVDEDWPGDPRPLHAGNYTAKVTVDGVAAQTEYTISQVKWETPAEPKIIFKVDGEDKSIIEITDPLGDNIEYMIKRLNTSTNEREDIQGYTGWLKDNDFTGITFGYYYFFYAKKCADRDHLESTPSRSDAYLADGGNIVYIKNATGIKVEPKYGDGSFEYTVSADDGYHLKNYTFNASDGPIPGKDGAKNENGITISDSGPTDGKYTYKVEFKTDLVTYWQVTLEFSGAVKNASVTHKVTDGEVFGDFNGKDTSISRDSAFTARFTVSDYIPEEYNAQALSFSEALPVGTTVIMKTADGYWYYIFKDTKSIINLSEFIAMGGTEPFDFVKDGSEASNFTYQFIVDFSKVAESSLSTESSLGVSLVLTANTVHGAPTIPAVGSRHITLGMNDKAEFNIKVESVVGKSATLKCVYTPSAGAASIWDGRKTALVLTAPGTAPADLTLTAVVDGNTTLYTMNSAKQFVIPLGGLGSKEITKEIKITLNSNLFGLSDENLEFTANWYVSRSSVEKSPLNGYSAKSGNVTFSCKKDAVSSVRIDGTDRLCHAGEKLNVTVNYLGIPSEGTVTAYLQSKTGGQYVDTGAKVSVSNDASTEQIQVESIQFSMGRMDKGSYRILVIVQESGANILQVPYYFVIA